MQSENPENSLQTLHEIRSIMERSARFLSLSGWSGVWAGGTALVGACIAHGWLRSDAAGYTYQPAPLSETVNPYTEPDFLRLLLLAAVVFAVALVGGFYFTWKKVKAQGGTLWNNASRSMLRSIAIPMICGGIFSLAFVRYGDAKYVAPACLVFYGLALYNGSKYTLTDIRYLGMLEIALGCINLFFPGYGLWFWACGFGVLHILYGIMMWNKYDKAGG
ncbi:MAG TPA: hypothetical protein VL098_15320 [Flavipsychrobacter sp.]|nr:hypothetical protein [Flavipsychrobacter sp.]